MDLGHKKCSYQLARPILEYNMAVAIICLPSSDRKSPLAFQLWLCPLQSLNTCSTFLWCPKMPPLYVCDNPMISGTCSATAPAHEESSGSSGQYLDASWEDDWEKPWAPAHPSRVPGTALETRLQPWSPPMGTLWWRVHWEGSECPHRPMRPVGEKENGSTAALLCSAGDEGQ